MTTLTTGTVDVNPTPRAPALVMIAAIGACSFPDVDYVDGGSDVPMMESGGVTGSTSSGTSSASVHTNAMCPAPLSCANDAASCADAASKANTMCTKHCHSQACFDQCATARASALGTCAAVCESCAASTCSGSSTNCDAIVGH